MCCGCALSSRAEQTRKRNHILWNCCIERNTWKNIYLFYLTPEAISHTVQWTAVTTAFSQILAIQKTMSTPKWVPKFLDLRFKLLYTSVFVLQLCTRYLLCQNNWLQTAYTLTLRLSKESIQAITAIGHSARPLGQHRTRWLKGLKNKCDRRVVQKKGWNNKNGQDNKKYHINSHLCSWSDHFKINKLKWCETFEIKQTQIIRCTACFVVISPCYNLD